LKPKGRSMNCSRCGSPVYSLQTFCNKCGAALASSPANIPSSAADRLSKARFGVGFACFLAAIILLSTLESAAAWIGVLALVVFAVGWSVRFIQFRTKVAFVIVTFILVAGAEGIERSRLEGNAIELQKKRDQIKARDEMDARISAQREENAFNKMTPAEHLAATKDGLKVGCPEDKVADGMKHLAALRGTPLESQGSAVLSHYEGEERKAQAAAQAANAAETRKNAAEKARLDMLGRDAMAKSIEDGMLSEGYNVDVNAIGSNHTILRIKFILVDKAFAYQTAHSPEIIGTAREAGFKKIVLTDGYDELWNINL